MTNRVDQRSYDIVIAINAALSGVVDIGQGYYLTGLEIPAAWTAADLVFECTNSLSTAGVYGTFLRLQDIAGTILRVSGIPTATAVGIPLWGLDRMPWRYIKVRSVGAGLTTDLNQGAARTLKLIVTTLG